MTKDVLAQAENLVRRATGKSSEELTAQSKAAVQQKPKDGALSQLPLFQGDLTSALPNYLVRTPLFSPTRAGRRLMHDSTRLPSPEGVEVNYTGKQLDMSDQDVFMHALKLAQGVDLTSPVLCNRADFLKKLGWKSSGKRGAFGKSAYEWLDQSFQRLTSGTLSIRSSKYNAHLSLVSEWIQDNETGDWSFTIGPKIRTLFHNNEYSLIDLQKRSKIATRVDLCKWIQSYAASHERGVHRVSIAKLKEWCGYTSPLRKFREALSESLEELVRVKVLTSIEFYKDDAMVMWIRDN